AQARYQSPVQGRFTSVDPMMGSAGVTGPQSWNRYSYVSNNPINSTDPTGMMAADASLGYGEVSGMFAGPWDLSNNVSHFGGPQDIADAAADFGQRLQNTLDAKAATAAYARGDYDLGDCIEASNSTLTGSGNLSGGSVTASATVGEPQNPAVIFDKVELLDNAGA